MELAACPDGELAARALAGQQTAYGELMRRHRDAIFRLLRGHTGDDDAAIELTQQSFIAAFGALARYEQDRPFRPWIARVAINKARDWARRRAVRRMFTFARPLEAAAHVADDSVSAEEGLADKRELTRVMTGISKLPANLREVLLLRTVEGLSQAEVAKTLGISEKAVETRLYRARAQLQKILRD